MKKNKFSIGLLSAIFIYASTLNISCKKAIEIDSVGYVTSDSAIRSESDLTNLLNSGYFALAADNYYGGSYQVYNELLADHIDGSTLDGDYLAAYNRAATIFTGGISSMYGQISKPIYQGNLVLDHIDLASSANKNLLIGQAKFMRGLAFFDMVRIFAQPYTAAGAATTPGIPLRLNSQRQQVVRSTVAEVYAQILSDLKTADTLLPTTNGVYATKYAAEAFIAKVYFQMNDFTNAYIYADRVIQNSGRLLDPSFANRYSPNGTPESLFSLVYELNNVQGRFQTLHGGYNTLGSTLPGLKLTSAFYAKATGTTTDMRKVWYSSKNGFYLLGKFDSSSIKLPVITLTEIKLIRAEAAAETGNNLSTAIADMNDIITRAYGVGSIYAVSPAANAAAIKDAARRERELELVGEGNWVQELKRRGAKGEAISIRGAAYNCPGLIFPFPTNEVNYSAPGFIQNPVGGCN